MNSPQINDWSYVSSAMKKFPTIVFVLGLTIATCPSVDAQTPQRYETIPHLESVQQVVPTSQYEVIPVCEPIPQHRETVHRETVHRETVHRETVHRETVHRETVHRETVHREVLHREAVYQQYGQREYRPHAERPTGVCLEPGWCGVVFAQGALKEQIESTPIELRPYRPFHFYGNTVRRMYYRGTALPSIDDLENGTRALLGWPTFQ
ncbi:MAG: hypothetical protein ACI9HK_004789 [Pirellulaceae bacterium]|jgi:hypothetical protein